MAETSVVVTGAGGFIGGHLAAALVRDGCRVRAFMRYTSRADRGSLEWHPADVVADMEVVFGDLRDADSVRRVAQGADVIFHLGAQIAIPYSYENPRDFIETNVLGGLHVAQAALEAGVRRVVHTSTSEVYGSAQATPMTEAHPLVAQSPYAASKIGADKVMESFARSFGLPVTTLRPFNTYGPHQSARAVIPTLLAQAVAGGDLALGALDTRRDLTFVSDTVAGFLAAASAPGVEGVTVHLGTGQDVSIADLVVIVGELLGRTLTVRVDEARLRPAASEVTRLLSDPRLASELLGWQPRVSLREGLSQTLSWVESHPEHFRPGYRL